MKKSAFLEIEKKYLEGRARLQGIKKGDLVWDEVPRGGFEMDYHPAVVKSVNVDEDYVGVVDVSRGDREFKYETFVTEAEMIKKGFTKQSLEEERKKYSGIIKLVMESK